jgi:dehydrogenase/reductase SDR family protein 12
MAISPTVDALLDAAIVPSFTNLGYRVRGLEPVTDRLDGKRVVVTGATSGLGRSAAGALAGLGAQTVLVGRNAAKAEATAAAIRSEHPDANVALEIADLSLMAEVRALGDRLSEGPPIDVLVNNAGSLFPERRETAEGLELTLATNLAGHFLLTNSVAGHLAEGGRIINVTSGGAYTQRISLSYLRGERGYDGATKYAQTKRGQIILTALWAERFAGRLHVHAMHPGWANTPGVESSLPGFYRVTKPFLRTPDQGADTIVWLAAAPEGGTSSGQLWLDRRPRPFHKLKRTRESGEQRRALWDFLHELTAR